MQAEEVCTVEEALRCRGVLRAGGFLILKESISPESLDEAKRNIGKAMTDMWDFCIDNMDKRRLLNGELEALDPYRNSTNGFGNASFGYLYKQFLPKEEYPNLSIAGTTAYFDLQTPYHDVTLQMLVHPQNLASTAAMLAVLHLNGMVSWNSIKVARNPRPEPKTMTKQALTAIHFDQYSSKIERIQVIDNNDGRIKLFFVPGSNFPECKRLIAQLCEDDDMYRTLGYCARMSRYHDVTAVLREFAVAPPPRGRVMWLSNVIHFEGRSEQSLISDSSHPFCDCIAFLTARMRLTSYDFAFRWACNRW